MTTSSTDKLLEYQTLIDAAEAEIKKHRAAQTELAQAALAEVVATHPRNAADVIARLGEGIHVDEVAAKEPILSPESIAGQEQAYIDELKADAMRKRKAAALAVSIIMGAAKMAAGV